MDREIGGGRGAGGRQFLEDQRGVEPAETAAAELVLHIDPGKTERRGLAQRLDRKLLALVPTGRMGQPFIAGEVARGLLKRPLLVGEGEIHGSNQERRFIAAW